MDMEQTDFPTRSNPLQQTKRSRLQHKRCNLNEQISKQLRLKAGAENLLKATDDNRLRQQINLELSFVSSNIQVLRNELGELNTAVHAYQSEKSSSFLPLIPSGLKQTTDVNFEIPFKDFILEHYSVDGNKFDREINQLTQLRRKAMQPSRDECGIDLLHQYFSHLSLIDKRFFGSSSGLAIYFTWFDALTGEPSIQRSVAFEKGSTVFNIAALHTQMAAKCERNIASGLCSGIEHLKTAAGLFIYLRDNFSHAPSADMRFEILNALIRLLMAQAYELQLDQLRLELKDQLMDLETACHIARQAAFVSCQFGDCRRGMQTENLNLYIPMAWSSLCAVKRDHYLALAYYWTAKAIIPITQNELDNHTENLLLNHFTYSFENFDDGQMLKKMIVSGLLKQSALMHEDSLTCVRLCKDLRGQASLIRSLKMCQESSIRLLNDNEPEYYYPEAPSIKGVPEEELIPIKPRFKNYKVYDFFHELGPPNVFCARRQWTSPRQVVLTKTGLHSNFGFSIRGDAPVCINNIETCGLAEAAGLCTGDIIVALNGQDTKWSCHDSVVRMLSRSGSQLEVQVISPRRASLTPAKSLSSLSSASASNSISPPTTLALKSRTSKCNEPKSIPASASCASRTPRFARKSASWSLKNLITLKKISKSVPNIHSQDLYCV